MLNLKNLKKRQGVLVGDKYMYLSEEYCKPTFIRINLFRNLLGKNGFATTNFHEKLSLIQSGIVITTWNKGWFVADDEALMNHTEFSRSRIKVGL